MSLPAISCFPTTEVHHPLNPPPPQPPPSSARPPLSSSDNATSKQSLFMKPEKNLTVVSWTSSIAGYCRQGQLSQAVSAFSHMLHYGVEPNDVTITTLVSGCSDFPDEAGSLGSLVHGLALKSGMARDSVIVGTTFIGMYGKRGDMESARSVFDGMSERNSITWNTMIDAYMRNREIGTALELFEEMPHRDAVSWTVLINGFVKGGHFEQALDLFSQMQLSGVESDYVTILSVLAACANLGSLGLGMWVHRFIMSKRFRDNVRVCNSLIDMYCRCGCVEIARQVFETMPEQTIVSWNSMIVGSAVNGHAKLALELFDRMQEEGFQPDGVSFTGALTACSHAGLVEEGLRYFDTMKRVHRIKPRIEHFGCIVDLYSRAGRLEDALRVIETMPMKPNEVVLGSVLAACRTHEDVNLAEKLMKYLVDVDPDSDSNYVLLANIYAAAGEWDMANKIRRKMKSRGIQKKPGYSSVEVSCANHKFVSCDKSHPDTEQIYAMLDLLSFQLRFHGYAPDIMKRALWENDKNLPVIQQKNHVEDWNTGAHCEDIAIL